MGLNAITPQIIQNHLKVLYSCVKVIIAKAVLGKTASQRTNTGHLVSFFFIFHRIQGPFCLSFIGFAFIFVYLLLDLGPFCLSFIGFGVIAIYLLFVSTATVAIYKRDGSLQKWVPRKISDGSRIVKVPQPSSGPPQGFISIYFSWYSGSFLFIFYWIWGNLYLFSWDLG